MIELRVEIDRIDYGSLAQQAIPFAIKRLSVSHGDSKIVQVLQSLGGLPAGAAKLMLNAMPQETKDAVALAFLQSYKDELAELINNFAEQKGLSLTITDIWADRKTTEETAANELPAAEMPQS